MTKSSLDRLKNSYRVRYTCQVSQKFSCLFQGPLHYNFYEKLDLEAVCECLLGYSFLLSCPIKVLKITEFVGDIGEIVQMKHVLGKLPCLELLEVHVQARRDDKKLQIMADLLMLPRTSSKCKVKVHFS